MGAVDSELFCLKWNDFQTSLTTSFAELRAESDLLDATLVCEGQTIKAHRLVLSASSGVFRQMFKGNNGLFKSGDPVIMMWEIKAEDLKLLINFMYEGQVNVPRDNLSTFLALAERLQVRGLAQQPTNNGFVSTTSEARNPSTTSPVTPALKRPRTSATLSDDLSNGDPNVINIKQEHPQDAVFATNNANNTTSVPSYSSTNQFNQFFADNTATDQTNNLRANSTTATNATNSNDSNPGFMTSSDEFTLANTAPSGIVPETTHKGGNVVVISTSNELASQSVATLATLPPLGAGGCVTATSTSCVTPTAAPTRQSASSSSSSQSNGGTCVHCNKTFRQLRSHIQDVHCPTPTPCPLCGKMFSSKHKMFGHKYRSCPNRTRNLVRHLQDLEGQHQQPGPQQQQQQQHLQNNENQQPF